jgi:hypothetical protein
MSSKPQTPTGNPLPHFVEIALVDYHANFLEPR